MGVATPEQLLAEIQTLQRRKVDLDVRIAALRARYEEARARPKPGPLTDRLVAFAQRSGPFTIAQAIEAEGGTYGVVAATLGHLVRCGRLERAAQGVYRAPQMPQEAPKPVLAVVGAPQATTAPSEDEEDEPDDLPVDAEGLPAVTAPVGSQMWKFEMRARREARRARHEEPA